MVANTAERITVYDVAGLFKSAHLKTTTQVKEFQGFQKCGLFLHNSEIFSDNDHCAAEVTNEAYPAVMNSAVECIPQNRLEEYQEVNETSVRAVAA